MWAILTPSVMGGAPKMKGEWGRGQKGVCVGRVGQGQGPQGSLGTVVVGRRLLIWGLSLCTAHPSSGLLALAIPATWHTYPHQDICYCPRSPETLFLSESICLSPLLLSLGPFSPEWSL